MSFIKISSAADGKNKCIRFDTQYTHCEITTSRFDKLQHMLGLYDTIEALTLVVDCPLSEWKIIRPLDAIKHLYLDARTKYNNRPGVLPENIWLMFPNLETIITGKVYIPIDNLDTLQNLNTFRLIWGASKIKKTDTKIQEIVQVLANMTSLIDIQIISAQKCHIPDELFLNNTHLKYVDFARNAVINNIPSILNCRELVGLHLKIDLLANPYILELSGLEYFKIRDHFSSAPIPDEIFAAPIFATCTGVSNIYVELGRINYNGANYKTRADKNRLQHVPYHKIANGNFNVSPYFHD
jgi:hypothetical protein